MSDHPYPCLRLAIDRLTVTAEPGHFAIWVLDAPLQAGYVHHDCVWNQDLTDAWNAWQEMFSLQPVVSSTPVQPLILASSGEQGTPTSYTARLMQHLGVSLWQWLFDGPILSSYEQSRGVARGQNKSLRLRLEVRHPDLISLPWEIMQPQAGMQAIGLSQSLLFSRTTNEVESLGEQRDEHALKILLVQGVDSQIDSTLPSSEFALKLHQEAEAIAQVLRNASDSKISNSFLPPVPCEVNVLVQPTPADLTAHLETKHYNVLFYSGHGMPGPDGGMLYLRPDATLNGTELAQVLKRCQVRLAVFNACWGAQPHAQDQQPMPRSSLAEVLIHHGVPAVLGMRDVIADHEAHSFIEMLAKALLERSPIDEAVAIARQHLLTLYRFNNVAWTLPVLYMHPEFNGELVKPLTDGVTEIPENPSSWMDPQVPPAMLRSVDAPGQVWRVYGGMMRIGSLDGNDLVLRGSGVSRRHAEIFYRDSMQGSNTSGYFLRDDSRYGTLLLGTDNRWYRVHKQEVPLLSPTRLCFGVHKVEFWLDNATG
ncbi:CHAT domain-containing protein [Leptolyngbya sp. AN02str]|uniref:CHAT domain-containing protein n=1 Tax=Leptolyngbya sp. AN02str TaxID=3423363 RepID=UPI003D31BA30